MLRGRGTEVLPAAVGWVARGHDAPVGNVTEVETVAVVGTVVESAAAVQ